MKRELVFVLVLTLLTVAMVASPYDVQLAKATPTTWYVDDDGGADFTRIQDAIDAASDNDTIFVYNGTYYEHLTIAYKRLAIIGECKYGAVIDGLNFSVIVSITFTTAVTFRNFTVRNGGWGATHDWHQNCAFFLSGATLCEVSSNVISDTRCGVFLDQLSRRNSISNNTISDIHVGIGSNYPFCVNNRITGNSISNCSNGIYFNSAIDMQIIGNTVSNWTLVAPHTEGLYGIHLESPGGYNNTIIGNTVIGYCDYAIAIRYAYQNYVADNVLMNSFYGIALEQSSSSNIVMNNTAVGNGVGVHIADNSYNSLISNNTFSDSIFISPYLTDIGIWVESSHEHMICNNEIINNGWGLLLLTSNNTMVYHNNFVDNAAHTFASNVFGTVWDDGYPSGGNYWSGYSTTDLFSGKYQNGTGSDCIGDTQYQIDVDNQDRYPYLLVSGWQNYPIFIQTNTMTWGREVTETALGFFSSGLNGSVGYVNATIPKGLNTTNIQVSVDGIEPSYPFPSIQDNGTHFLVYFEFSLSIHHIVIVYGVADISVAGLTVFKTIVAEDSNLEFSINIENLGEYTETINVTAYANLTLISSKQVTLLSDSSTTVDFSWDTHGAAKGGCKITIIAVPLLGELVTSNNAAEETVFVTILGDTNGDKKVDISDITMTIAAYGKTSASPGWLAPSWYANRDVSDDDKIDITDIVIVIGEYGSSW